MDPSGTVKFIPNIDFSWSNSSFLWLFKDEIEPKVPGRLWRGGVEKNISLGSSFSSLQKLGQNFGPESNSKSKGRKRAERGSKD